jgi:hypothetical protein
MHDLVYLNRRAREEHLAAKAASNEQARAAHAELARTYRQLLRRHGVTIFLDSQSAPTVSRT